MCWTVAAAADTGTPKLVHSAGDALGGVVGVADVARAAGEDVLQTGISGFP